jgi:hypothetical protein
MWLRPAVLVLLIGNLASVAQAQPEIMGDTKVERVLGAVERGMKVTRYKHHVRVDVKKGLYEWDCSIMAAWVLRRAAPRALAAVHTQKPLARDFYAAVAAAPTDTPRKGWLRLTDLALVKPGDVFAWVKPGMFKFRPNTGHVGFVVGAPWKHPQYDWVWLVRIADATTELHEDDSRTPGGEGGFGTATIAFSLDDAGLVNAYGWYGEDQPPWTYVPTRIVFGRAVE